MLTLFNHPNAQVWFNAATSLIGPAREQARKAIQDIADSKAYPIAGEAGMYLSMLDGELAYLRNR